MRTRTWRGRRGWGRRGIRGLVLLLGMALLITACRGPAVEQATPATPATDARPAAAEVGASPDSPLAAGLRTPDPPASTSTRVQGLATAPGSAAESLVVWVPTGLWPAAETGAEAAGGAFGATLEAFQAAHPHIAVAPRGRLARGAAGIGAFLQSTDQVVPARLPDVALLPLDGLSAAGAAGLITPLAQSELSARALDTYPFAAAAVRLPRGAWGVPVALDVVHAIGREAPPPATWSALRAGGGLVLPAGGADLADLAAPLALYGAAGGDLEYLGTPDPAAVTGVLDLLSGGFAAGRLLPPNNGRSPRAAWNTLVTGEAPAAIVSGAVFAPQQAKFPGIVWGPVPGPSGPARPVGWGWAWVVTARDPARVGRALAFIDWFSDPAHGAWITEAGYLPARRGDGDAGLAAAFDPPPAADYRRFLTDQLDAAGGATGFDTWGPGWAAMLDDVLAGRPIDAARERLGRADV